MEENFFDSKIFKTIVLTIAALLVIILAFCLGFVVANKRADFSFKWAESYHRNFGGPPEGFFGVFMGGNDGFTAPNGVFGQVISIETDSITVRGGDNMEKSVHVSDKTSIVMQKSNLKISDIKVGDDVVVIGYPTNNGDIQAQLIRVIPQPINVPSIYRGITGGGVILERN